MRVTIHPAFCVGEHEISRRKNTVSRALPALILVAGMPCAFAASSVSAGVASPGARASIDFSVNVPRVMQLKLLAHPNGIDITADDIARGTVKVIGAAVHLLVNDRNGYAIRADLATGAFTAVKISGLPSPLMATTSGGIAQMPSMVGKPRPLPMAVEYELQLAADAQPGHYAWPVTLSLQQL